jgi:hypothetical protein
MLMKMKPGICPYKALINAATSDSRLQLSDVDLAILTASVGG